MDLRELLSSLSDHSHHAHKLNKASQVFETLALAHMHDGMNSLEAAVFIAEAVAPVLSRLCIAYDPEGDHQKCSAGALLNVVQVFNNHLFQSMDYFIDNPQFAENFKARASHPSIKISVSDNYPNTHEMLAFGNVDLDKSDKVPEDHEFAVPAGDNKDHIECCPSCASTGIKFVSHLDDEHRFFTMRDHAGAVRYTETGLCQKCQDFEDAKGH